MKSIAACLLGALVFTAAPAAAQLSVVQEERAKLTAAPPVGTVAAFEVTKRVAARVGGGVLKKPAGNNVDGFAVDIVCFANGTIVDILGDSEGAATPSWNVLPETRRPDECQIPPPGAAAVPPPVTPPPPPPPAVDLSGILARLSGLEAKLAELLNVVDTVHKDTWRTREVVERLESRPANVTLPPIDFPNYSATLLGQRVTLRPIK